MTTTPARGSSTRTADRGVDAAMTSNPHVFRINARELLRQPGLTKHVVVEIPAAELGVDDDRITGPVAVDLVAVSSIDGISVQGSITMPWATSCRRCLAAISGDATIDVDERYRDDVRIDDDAFEIDGDQIDLGPAIREHVVLGLPDDRLCRDACAGLCPVCGIDRNVATCKCDTTVRDERWAALDQLDLDHLDHDDLDRDEN